MLSKFKIKRFLEDEHSVDEHLNFIYFHLLEIVDELEDLRGKLNFDSNSLKVKVNLRR